MKACKQPCDTCPFRKDSVRGFLADYTVEGLHRLVMSEVPFPCHSLLKKDISFDQAHTGAYTLCAGALRYMKINFKSPRNPKVAKLVNSLNKQDLENILSAPEFFEHHTPIKNKKINAIKR